jgi:hypothetical protein
VKLRSARLWLFTAPSAFLVSERTGARQTVASPAGSRGVGLAVVSKSAEETRFSEGGLRISAATQVTRDGVGALEIARS